MSRHRHEMKKRAAGGKLSSKPVWNAGGGQNAAKEAEERKHGGKVLEGEGEHAKSRHDRHARARGGMIPGRKRGGGIGANKTPLSTAATIKRLPGEEAEDEHKSD